jgi:hypothetical protein
MKTHVSTRLALAGTLALFTHTALAQNWQTVDDFQVHPRSAEYARRAKANSYQ